MHLPITENTRNFLLQLLGSEKRLNEQIQIFLERGTK